MFHFFRKTLACLLVGVLLIGSAAMAENIYSDVTLHEVPAAQTDADYYQKAIETEIYNYKLVRNLPTTFTQESWEKYCSLANGLVKLDPDNLAEVQKRMVDDAIAARKELVQALPLNESIWYIWGEDIATVEEDVSALNFTKDSYDNADFIPFLTPYLVENQEEAKGNLIIIAGGGYSGRNNSGEGWPIAARFNALGFNCYVLQRRVAPYANEDIWMDLQRAIRYIRHNAEAYGLGGMNCLAAVGFSGGGLTICGALYYLYGDIQPTVYDPDYVPDEVDKEPADLDVALILYGASEHAFLHDQDGAVPRDFPHDNPNMPALFFGIGEDDSLIGKSNHNMAEAYRGKVMVEEHTFANVGHGFGVGSDNNNTMYWIDMAANFMVMATGDNKTEAAAPEVEIPAQYTKVQEFDYSMPFGDVYITCAMNETEDAFYLFFTAFDDLQLLEGVIENGTPIVTFDRTGFMAGDINNFLGAIDPNAWTQR